MKRGDVRTCSRDRNTLDAVHQSARHAGKSPINQNGKGGANPGHDGKSYMTLVTMRPLLGGYARKKGDAPSTAHPTITLPGGLSETIVEVRRQARTPPGQVR